MARISYQTQFRLLLAAVLTVGILLVVIPTYLVFKHLHFGQAATAARYDYPGPLRLSCPFGSRQGEAGTTQGATAEKGFRYVVKTPTNYDANQPHPLLVVFAPATISRTFSERYTGLTHAATSRGFIIVYADSQPLSTDNFREFDGIAGAVVERWCVDPERIYYTGHSDGGTSAMAMAFLEGIRNRPDAIVASAAGIRGQDLADYECPGPTEAMVLHNRGDDWFPLPEYGWNAAQWWARCNGCDPERTQILDNGCKSFQSCQPGGRTLYCERPGGHLDWPDMNTALLDFFTRAGAQP